MYDDPGDGAANNKQLCFSICVRTVICVICQPSYTGASIEAAEMWLRLGQSASQASVSPPCAPRSLLTIDATGFLLVI